MNATELQINDWVKYSNEYFQVDGYFRVTNTLILKYNGHSSYYQDGAIVAEDSEPIPLTAGILKKNGFIWDGGQIWDIRWDDEDGHHCMNFRKMYSKSDGVWDGLGIIMGGEIAIIKFVHELQRVLRCCGLDELADNFKV